MQRSGESGEIMEPVPLIFSCDTEDYETPAADDAELLWARMFTRHGIRACFCVVGEEARALRDRGRRDVLEALAGHEVASHSDMHSAHPTPAEYLDQLPWGAGVQRFLAEEGRAVQDLREILGQQPSAWCKPGNSWGPVVPHGAALLGMPVFCDAPFEWAPGHPLRFAGSLLVQYHTSFDRYFDVPTGERLARMRTDFAALLATRQEGAALAGGPPGVIVMYTHPCRTVTASFPSNFTAGARTPRAAWQPSPLRRREAVDALVRDFDAFLQWVAELRAGGRIVLTTYRELHRAHRLPPAPWLSREDVLALARPLAADDAPLEPRRLAEQWLSPAEQFGAVAWALARRSATGALPSEVPLRRLLGPLDPPGVGGSPELPAPGTTARRHSGAVTAADIVGAAVTASEACTARQAVPLSIPAGGTSLGPGRFLRLAARALLSLAGPTVGNAPPALLAVPPGGDATVLAGREDFARLRFRNSWSVFPPEFEGQRLLEQTRWQTWSAAPA